MSKKNGRFPKKTKQTLAERAGYLCSNPFCRRHTSGPHSNPEKSTILGEAAHIKSLKPDTPARRLRYDPNMTNEERADISNGIWLCAACHKVIDGDALSYPTEVLNEWKKKAEEQARKEMEGEREKRRENRFACKVIIGMDGKKQFVKEDRQKNRLEDPDGFYVLARKAVK